MHLPLLKMKVRESEGVDLRRLCQATGMIFGAMCSALGSVTAVSDGDRVGKMEPVNPAPRRRGKPLSPEQTARIKAHKEANPPSLTPMQAGAALFVTLWENPGSDVIVLMERLGLIKRAEQMDDTTYRFALTPSGKVLAHNMKQDVWPWQ